MTDLVGIIIRVVLFEHLFVWKPNGQPYFYKEKYVLAQKPKQ
jgi:hypothetical protein